jgi:hypothetical protein
VEQTDAGARETVRRHLRPGEELIWAGKPDAGWRLGPSDWFLIPFGIFWDVFILLFVASGLASVVASGEVFGLFFVLFGIPFVVVGWFLTIGRFRSRAAQRRRTTYALTDRRVLAVETGSVDSVRSVFLQGLPGVGERIGRDGVGTLSFEPVPLMWAMYAGSGLEWMMGGLSALPLQFFDIPDASRVAALIQEQREAVR